MGQENKNRLLQIAFILSIITIAYNVIEGVISIYFGLADDTLALLGFGLDSFVEVISGLGIAHMIWRMRLRNVHERDKLEVVALRITGISFYILTAGLVVGSVINLVQQTKPETTVIGIIVSSVSILTMYFLMKYKLKVGKALNSEAIVADANCTKTCFYLSIILLISSALYELFGIGYIDILGSLAIAYYAYKEGVEALENAKSRSLGCSCGSDHCEQ